jgi:hypothetical protein
MRLSPSKDYQIWDAKVRGFGVRIYPSGVKAFVLQYRNSAGRTRKTVLGRFGILTVETAREKAIKLLGAILDGGDPSRDKRESRNARTVGELADLYLSEGSVEKPNKNGRAGRPIALSLDGTSSPYLALGSLAG